MQSEDGASLAHHLRWLDTPGCTCPTEWRSYGRLYGISMGEGWVRVTTDPACPDHAGPAVRGNEQDDPAGREYRQLA
jgi:hypothetical protein